MLTVFQLILYSLVSGELFEVHLVLICLFPFVCYILFFLPIVHTLLLSPLPASYLYFSPYYVVRY